MCSDIAIKISGVSKHYQIYSKPIDRLKQSLYRGRKQFCKEFKAVENISLEILKGETVGIIGRNGSGKSTLLQMICGTLTPSNGEIAINGKVAALLELGAGFNPEFTGRENVFLNAALYGLSNKQISERFDQIANFADIGEFIDQPVKTYSSGMYVRLAFAVITHVDADVLVIDEALAVGDVYFVQKCMRFLRSFTENGTLLFVSHDTSAVVGLCTKAILMNDGELECIGAPKDVSEYYLSLLHKSNSVGNSNKDNVPVSEENKHIDQFTSINNNNFGAGQAKIISTILLDKAGNTLTSVRGEEEVSLVIECLANTRFEKPIVGFLVRDRLGQIIFGDNTYLSCHGTELVIEKDQVAKVTFQFIMPVLQSGDYSVTVAIAQGEQDNHQQHHWVHDALIIRSRLPFHSFGLISLIMKNVSFLVNENE